jgi:hypothetical protein
LTEQFSNTQLTSCQCDDLLAVQDFRNENLGTFVASFMPMENTCAKLSSACNSLKNTTPQLLVDTMVQSIDTALSYNVISNAEHELLEDFFLDYFVEGVVDFEYYWCQLGIIEKSDNVNPDHAGLASAFILTIFQMPYDYAINHPDYFSAELQSRWVWKVIRGGLLWDGIKKYAKSMHKCYEGIRDGWDSSHEATEIFFD